MEPGVLFARWIDGLIVDCSILPHESSRRYLYIF